MVCRVSGNQLTLNTVVVKDRRLTCIQTAGMIAQKSILGGMGGKASVAPSKPTTVSPPNKRSFDTYDEADSENVDPRIFDSPSKKSKSDAKPFVFSLSPSKAMLPPPLPSRLTTPTRANMSSPRAPMTAPAGRSPKRKAAGGIQKSRRISAPFSRVDPPFASRTIGSALPFSLDAAIHGSLNTSSAPVAAPTPRSHEATIQESMPKNWFFEIYEDTAEEEAANLMEHSTLTLDLSSDDESATKERDDRGKENTPPDNYDAPTASRAATTFAALASPVPARVKKADIIRKKLVSIEDEMDDGQRSPLDDLETDSFIPEGLDKHSHVVVDGPPTTTTKSVLPPSVPSDLKKLFTTPLQFASNRTPSAETTSSSSTAPPAGHKRAKSSKFMDLPVVTADGELKGEILVWEDTSASEGNSSIAVDASEDGENVAPGSVAK